MSNRSAIAALVVAAASFPAFALAQTAAPVSPGGAAATTMGQSCTMQSQDKKLSGAAQKNFMTKSQRDATTNCTAQASEKKLRGAAKNSFTKKCVTDAVGA